MSPAQCRAARAFRNISREDLAKNAGLSFETIEDFECGRTTLRRSSTDRIVAALLSFGIELLDTSDGIGMRRVKSADTLSIPLQPDLRIASTSNLDPRQSRAARGFLTWDQHVASAEIRFSLTSYNGFEMRDEPMKPQTTQKAIAAFARYGVSFSRTAEHLSVHLDRVMNINVRPDKCSEELDS